MIVLFQTGLGLHGYGSTLASRSRARHVICALVLYRRFSQLCIVIYCLFCSFINIARELSNLDNSLKLKKDPCRTLGRLIAKKQSRHQNIPNELRVTYPGQSVRQVLELHKAIPGSVHSMVMILASVEFSTCTL